MERRHLWAAVVHQHNVNTYLNTWQSQARYYLMPHLQHLQLHQSIEVKTLDLKLYFSCKSRFIWIFCLLEILNKHLEWFFFCVTDETVFIEGWLTQHHRLPHCRFVSHSFISSQSTRGRVKTQSTFTEINIFQVKIKKLTTGQTTEQIKGCNWRFLQRLKVPKGTKLRINNFNCSSKLIKKNTKCLDFFFYIKQHEYLNYFSS